MIDFVWGNVDGLAAIFVAIINATWGTEFGFYDPERGGGIWYRLGFLNGAAALMRGSLSFRRR